MSKSALDDFVVKCFKRHLLKEVLWSRLPCPIGSQISQKLFFITNYSVKISNEQPIVVIIIPFKIQYLPKKKESTSFHSIVMIDLFHAEMLIFWENSCKHVHLLFINQRFYWYLSRQNWCIVSLRIQQNSKLNHFTSKTMKITKSSNSQRLIMYQKKFKFVS